MIGEASLARRPGVPAHDRYVFADKAHTYAIAVFCINEGERIRAQLGRMASLSEKADLIVADGGSTDGSLEWLWTAAERAEIPIALQAAFRGRPIPRRSWGYFMNLGFKSAQGEYVLMISDDCLLVPGAIDAGAKKRRLDTSTLRWLAVAFVAAVPVNHWLMERGKGHAVVHRFHEEHAHHH